MSLVSACRGAGAGVGNACVFFRRLGTPQSCRRRVLSSSSAFKDEKLRDLLFQRDFNVPSFGGALVASTPFNLSVEPVGTQDYPNLDRAFVTARSKVGSAHVKDKIKVKTSQEDNVLRVEPEKIEGVDSSSVKVSAQLPMVHNVDITAVDKATVDAADFLESDYFRVSSEKGDINVARIKSATICLQSESGDIACSGHIQGTVTVKTVSGHVIGDRRFTGDELDISTDSGDIRLASCYCANSKFSTNSGSMNLRNLHNDSYVAVYEKGDVSVQGLDGSVNIFVKEGDVDCHISRVRAESRVHVESGDVRLRLSDTYPLKLTIEADGIIPDAKFERLGSIAKHKDKEQKTFFCAIHPDKFSPTLLVIAESGQVVLESQDWAASLALKVPQSKTTT